MSDSPIVDALVAKLRRKLLDVSKSNRMLNFRHDERARTHVRIVATGLDAAFAALTAEGAAVPFRPVPQPLPEEPEDERTDAFRGGLTKARQADRAYVDAMRRLQGAADPERATKEALLERGLRDRLRTALAMPPRRPGSQRRAAEQARLSGIPTDYDLDADQDAVCDALQTLLYPDAMEAKLKAIESHARLAMEETGVQTLHAVFGFLEWYESPDSDRALLAPLVRLPVELKGTASAKGRQFRLTAHEDVDAEDEQPPFNEALICRLRDDFGIELPALEWSGRRPIETWLEKLEATFAPETRFRVHRYLTVTTLSFARYAMYLDLDAEAWPADRKPGDNPLARRVLHGGGTIRPSAPEHADIDDPAVEALAPILVTDADAAQHSAVIDAMRGDDLVIEGPPGTGKSQTITNLIANALHAGKRVLFVAEKLAALRVVKNRLDAAGLGPFCLELHSSKSKPSEVIESLNARIKLKPPTAPEQLDGWTQALRKQRSILRRYVDAIGRPVPGCGLTVQQVIGRERRAASALGDLASSTRLVSLASLATADPVAIQGIRDELQAFAQRHAEHVAATGGGPERNPWRFVTRTALSPFDREDLVGSVAALAVAVGSLQRQLGDHDIDLAIRPGATLAAITAWCDAIRALPKPLGQIWWELLPVLREPADRDAARALVGRVRQARDLEAGLRTRLPGFREIDPEVLDRAAALAERVGLAGSTVGTVAEALEAARRRRNAVERLVGVLATLRAAFPALGGAASIAQVLRAAEHARSRPACGPLHDVEPRWLERQQQIVAQLLRERADLGKLLAIDRLDVALLDQRIAEIESAGRLGLMFGKGKAAMDWVAGIAPTVDRGDAKRVVALLRRARKLLADEHAFATDATLGARLGSTFRGLATDFDMLFRALRWTAAVDTVAPADDADAAVARAWLLGPESPILPIAAADAAALRELVEALPADQRPEDVLARADALLPHLERLARVLEPIGIATTMPLADFAGLASAIRGLVEWERWIADLPLRAHLGPRFAGLQTDTEALAASVDLVEAIARAVRDPGTLDRLVRGDYRTQVRRLQDAAAGMADPLGKARSALERIGALAQADWSRLGDQGDPHTWALDVARARLDAANEQQSALAPQLAIQDAYALVERHGLESLEAVRLAKGLPAEALPRLFEHALWSTILRRAYAEDPVLAQLQGTTQADARKQFAKTDLQIAELQRQALVARLTPFDLPKGSATGPIKHWTEQAFLNNEIRKKSKHAPVRRLLRQAGGSVRALKPCILMSPLAVAQYLDRAAPPFDLVIIDEASQMRPEDALGAVLRTGQIVVVGDPRQLPPTDFFDRSEPTAEHDEDDVPQIDTESILDLCLRSFDRPRMLDIHYRSRHPSLIAFSNHRFYEGRLTAFPPPGPEHEMLGVELVVVPGVYQSGKLARGGGKNTVEAEHVVRATVDIIHRFPEQSLAIVAMNQPQRDLVEELIERAANDDPRVDAYRREWAGTLEPLIVKNLENIQGDERDVVIVSLVYGRDGEGRLYQRFGAINTAVGHRRLNVLLTRAKHKLLVFSSLEPTDVVPTSAASDGVHALRGFLEFARDRRLTTPPTGIVGEPDSPFETFVAERIRRLGYEVDHQVGEVGYRIDLGIRHESCPGRYLLGVECDGATYHRTRSTRDRDRLRQTVLESLGWRIHRVWSTDWFADADGQMRRIEAVLGEILAAEREVTGGSRSRWLIGREARADAAVTLEASEVREVVDDPTRAPLSDDAAAVPSEPMPGLSNQAQIRERLRRFRDDVIRLDMPRADGSKCILRDAMIEAMIEARLDEYDDFRSKIPQSLRSGTDGAKMRYLKQITDIIADMDE